MSQTHWNKYCWNSEMFHDSVCFDTFSLKYEMVHWNTDCSTPACRAIFHPVFDWFPTIQASCVCGTVLWNQGPDHCLLSKLPYFPRIESWLSHFSWCRLVRILDSCWSWKLHSCWVELMFVSLGCCPMTNFISKLYGFSNVLSFGTLKIISNSSLLKFFATWRL